MKKSQIFFFLSVSFIIGIAIGLSIIPYFLLLYILIIISILFLILLRKNINLKILFLGFIFLFLGILRANFSQLPPKDKNHIINYNEKKVIIRGTISKDPAIDENLQRLTLNSQWIKNMKASQFTEVKGLLLIYANLYPKFHYGEKIEITGKLKSPKPFENFRYDKNLAIHNIYSTCYQPKIKLLEKHKGNIIYEKILEFKDKMASIFKKNIAEPQSSILTALLLGNNYKLDKRLSNLFSYAGISHIISISGMHIAILGLIIIYLLNQAGIARKKASYISLIIIILYVIMIGYPASAVRSAIMAAFAIIALQFGRLSKVLNAIVFTICLMLLINPGILFYDIGFQLSFLSLLGIYYLYPIMNKIIKIKFNKPLKDLLTVSISAQIFILPLILYYFGILSLTSPLINVLILWTIPIIMFLGLSLLLFGLIDYFIPLFFLITKSISLIIEFLIKYIIIIAEIFTKGKWAVINLSQFPLWAVILCYIIITSIIIYSKLTNYACLPSSRGLYCGKNN